MATESDLAAPGTVYQLGLPPRRLDILTSISGGDFDTAWRTRLDVDALRRAGPNSSSE
ncbi:MAG: hypothetical protein IT385_08480 [Deltaproteobacteria bacterium]|nr:hypothetical protein [Deltaproteobacteria bacterium]